MFCLLLSVWSLVIPISVRGAEFVVENAHDFLLFQLLAYIQETSFQNVITCCKYGAWCLLIAFQWGLLNLLISLYWFDLALIGFSYLIASMGLQVLWSFGLACLDVYALRIKRDLHSPVLVSLFVVGDWVISRRPTLNFTCCITECSARYVPAVFHSVLATFWLIVILKCR